MSQLRAIVAIPVKDEAARIAACLRALAEQDAIRPDAIVLLINNTSDGTAEIARTQASSLGVAVHAIEHEFPPEMASAGQARRMAMERAALLLDGTPASQGVLLTTDADATVPPDWIAANLGHIARGLDAVTGRAVLDPADAAQIPDDLHANDALEMAYAGLLDQIASRLDPDPWDPWPRHCEHSGASIAVTLAAYRAVGGMPASPLAEDRKFIAALRRNDARIRHAPEIVVTVSGRTVGRAEGGMADTIRRRLTAPDPYLDDMLEPAADAVRRARMRAMLRRARAKPAAEREIAALAALGGVGLDEARAACAMPHAGAGIALLEATSPLLARQLVHADDVLRETAAAMSALREMALADTLALP